MSEVTDSSTTGPCEDKVELFPGLVESVRSNVEKKMNSGECSFTQDNEQCAIVRGAAQEGVHLIRDVTERTGRAIDHHNVEFGRKCDRDSVEFQSRSG